MAITKVVCNYEKIEIKSGKSLVISAVTDGGRTKEKAVVYRCGDYLSVDNKGKIIAEKTKVDRSSTLTIMSVVDNSIKKIVPVEIKKSAALKILPENISVISGEIVDFQSVFDFAIFPAWSVRDYDLLTGDITNTGQYIPPYPITECREIVVQLVDRSSGQIATTKVVLSPVEIKTGVQKDIPAGSRESRLNIFVNHDNKGGRNCINCDIISKPKIGTIMDGGFYTPPVSISEPQVIEVEAVHKDSPEIRGRITFKVVPACPKCKIALVGNDCPNCDFHLTPKTENVVASVRCFRCKSLRWNGTSCPKCGYPRAKKHYKF